MHLKLSDVPLTVLYAAPLENVCICAGLQIAPVLIQRGESVSQPCDREIVSILFVSEKDQEQNLNTDTRNVKSA